MSKTKYLLPLILIICLAFSLSVYSADLFGTYDQRIKFTVDHTKIDSDVTWFPITLFMTDSQMEEIFAEFDSDEDFDRCAITTSDEETQIYGDCELFDDSEELGIYHVAKTGVVTDDDVDTDYYFYYDNDADHNTTYISKSGGTAAQSVYDANYEAVYHMADSVLVPTTAKFYCKASSADSSNINFIVRDTDENWSAYEYEYTTSWVEIELDLTSPDTTSGTVNWGKINYIRFGNFGTDYIAYVDNVRIYDQNSDLIFSNMCEATTNWRVYQGNLTLEDTIVQEGDHSIKTVSTSLTSVGYTAYDPAAVLNWAPIVDSTSNANHGTKKGLGEPVEAVGQVGQGQDFDGTDDYIQLANDSFESDTAGTIEAIITRDTADKNSDIILSSSVTSAKNLLRLGISEASGSERGLFIQDYKTDGDDRHNYVHGDTILGTTQHYTAITSNDAAWALYVDGASEDLTTLLGSNTGNWFGDLLAGTHTVRIGQMTYDTTTHSYFEGIIDEVRVSNSVRTAAWIAATYASLWDTLLTYGNEETPTAGGNVMFMFSDF